ncbi:MAG: HAD family hydrolase, partial [Myxococcales bacterium]
RMAVRLAAAHAFRPIALLRTGRILNAYRRAQEELRTTAITLDLATAQLDSAAVRGRVTRDVVIEYVERWMHAEPLELLEGAARSGLLALAEAARRRGIRLAAVSDYPAEAKLEALGVRHLIDAVVCAQDPEVQRFKPDPRGLYVALDRLGVSTERAVYVGDRPDVDWPAARHAGMACFIIGAAGRPGAGPPDSWTPVSDFEELRHALLD